MNEAVRRKGLCLGGLGLGLAGVVWGDPVTELSAFPVYAGAVLVEEDLSRGQLSDHMEREVRVDMQTRGGARYQSDITIRGGIFEGTGLMVGGLALFDPQTGHYFSEIPLDPVFFSGARLLTGVNNAVHGFNSTAGSIDWNWAPLRSGGHAGITVGTDRHLGYQASWGGMPTAGVGWQVAVLREKGDGSLDFGDFDLKRVSGRAELAMGVGTLRVFGGHVEKFYGWPGMYTGNPGLHETEDYQVSLVGAQYLFRVDGQVHQIGGFWRRLDDDYEFRRETPNRFFEHLTEVWSVQGDGLINGEGLDLVYRWAYLQDKVRRSTSLVHGNFMGREYFEAAVLGQGRVATPWGELMPYAGIGLDTTNKDETVGTPQAGIRMTGTSDRGGWEVYTEYSESSQVPGYTVLNSSPTGLFGGNRDLGRERASMVEAGIFVQHRALSLKTVLFQRRDEDLVDWVYDSSTPGTRQAAAVDITVNGLESWLRWEFKESALEWGYAYLEKSPRYQSVSGDASFYALNFARHRFLISAERRFLKRLTARLETDYREQEENALRQGGRTALKVNMQVFLADFPAQGWRLTVRVDNLTDEDFQPVPGTPGPGRAGSATISYLW